MANSKKIRLSTKKLLAFDPQVPYDNRLVVVEGVVSPSSQFSWQGHPEGFETHCFSLAAWRVPGSPLVTRELCVLRPIRRTRDWPGVFQQHTIHRIEVLLSKDQMRAVFARRLRMTNPDEKLVEISLRLLQPVVLVTEEFGEFTLDRRLNWFDGKAKWKGKEIDMRLPGPTTVLLEEDADLPELHQPLQTLLKVWRAKKSWDINCKQLAIKELLAIKNKHWLEEGEAPLHATEFAARMQLTSISVDADGRLELWYDADEMFTDHAILVRATLENGPTDAGIEG